MTTAEDVAREEYWADGEMVVPYVRYGTGKPGKPTVLVHGISSRPTKWGRLPDLLDGPVVAIGIPGAAHTPRCPSMSFYTDAIERVIDDVVGDECDAVGFSWGCSPVQQLLQRGRIGRVVLMAGVLATPLAGWDWPDPRAQQAVRAHERTEDDIAALYGGKVRRDHSLITSLGLNRAIDQEHHARQLCAALDIGIIAIQNMWQRPMLAGRVLSIAGAEDPLIPLSGVRASSLLLNTRLEVIEDDGHGFPLTQPEVTATLINDFL